MKLLQKLAVIAIVLGLVQSVHASNLAVIDLGNNPSIPAGTMIPFQLDMNQLDSNNELGYEFRFDGAPMGHIELLGATRIEVYVDVNHPQASALVMHYGFNYYLTDKHHNPLPDAYRFGNLWGFADGGNIVMDAWHIDVPVTPGDVEMGGHFHDIHFMIPTLPTSLQTANFNAYLRFDADVQAGNWVPEPSGLAALASLGLVGVAGFWRSRRRKQAA